MSGATIHLPRELKERSGQPPSGPGHVRLRNVKSAGGGRELTFDFECEISRHLPVAVTTGTQGTLTYRVSEVKTDAEATVSLDVYRGLVVAQARQAEVLSQVALFLRTGLRSITELSEVAFAHGNMMNCASESAEIRQLTYRTTEHPRSTTIRVGGRDLHADAVTNLSTAKGLELVGFRGVFAGGVIGSVRRSGHLSLIGPSDAAVDGAAKLLRARLAPAPTRRK
jgi:hypothetical protein